MRKENIPLIVLLCLVMGLGIFWIFHHEPVTPELPAAIIEAASTPQPAPAPIVTPEALKNTPTPAPTATPIPATPTPTAAPTATPEPTPTQTPVPTVEPTASPSPSPSEEPTASPTADPNPPSYAQSGVMRSDTKTALNLVAYWSISEGGSTGHQLTVTLYAESSVLHAGGLWGDLSLTVNGNSVSGDSQRVDTEERALHETYLGTLTMDAASGYADVKAVWRFNGSYSGTDIDILEAADTIYIP